MNIADILVPSTIDYPGKVSMVIFLAGCNYKCPFCYNSALINASSGTHWTSKDLENKILENIMVIDAIVITGGEPTIQPKALYKICDLAEKFNLSIKIDTNGTEPNVISELVTRYNKIEYIAVDIKHLTNYNDYEIGSGVVQNWNSNPRDVIRTMKYAKYSNSNVFVEARHTAAFLTTKDFGKKLARPLRGIIDQFTIQQFIPEDTILAPENLRKDATPRNELIRLASGVREARIKNIKIKTREFGVEFYDAIQ